jgi:sulfane dehydrogenase subunit SoxC
MTDRQPEAPVSDQSPNAAAALAKAERRRHLDNPSSEGPPASPVVAGISRRSLVRSGGLLAGVAIGAPVLRAFAQTTAPSGGAALPASAAVPDSAKLVVPLDATKVPGMPSEALGGRSAFEQPALTPTGITSGSSWTPHQSLRGSITPSDLHFQRHHNGIPVIDPLRHQLTIHGLVDTPLTFTLQELQRFPSVTRVHFVECSGNGGGAYRAPKPDMTPQVVDGLTSNSEWTGVPVATLLKAVGVQRAGTWVLAEGGDAAVMLRSVPMEKMMDDALVVYAQNGDAVRPANGYPMRLLLPGYEGNMCVKWLRRLKVVDQPSMSRDETSKYTDPLPDGTSRQFSFVIDAKSLITSPAYPERLTGPGWWPVRGIAWSGRGKITGVDVSTNGGKTWAAASLVGDVHSRAHTRFEFPWQWNGQPAALMSRATDETGYVQPTLEVFRRVRGAGTGYHLNAIRTWNVAGDGSVTFGG